MKKSILALFILLLSVSPKSYSRDYVIYDDEPEYVCDYDDDYEYDICDEPAYVVHRPTVYYRRPARRTVVVQHHHPRVIHYSNNPVGSFFAELAGFGIGAAIGSACR